MADAPLLAHLAAYDWAEAADLVVVGLGGVGVAAVPVRSPIKRPRTTRRSSAR